MLRSTRLKILIQVQFYLFCCILFVVCQSKNMKYVSDEHSKIIWHNCNIIFWCRHLTYVCLLSSLECLFGRAPFASKSVSELEDYIYDTTPIEVIDRAISWFMCLLTQAGECLSYGSVLTPTNTFSWFMCLLTEAGECLSYGSVLTPTNTFR